MYKFNIIKQKDLKCRYSKSFLYMFFYSLLNSKMWKMSAFPTFIVIFPSFI